MNSQAISVMRLRTHRSPIVASLAENLSPRILGLLQHDLPNPEVAARSKRPPQKAALQLI
jgi:hypothetical protein